MSPGSSRGDSDFFIPQLVVLIDNITGRRPKLIENDKFNARGWSSFNIQSCNNYVMAKWNPHWSIGNFKERMFEVHVGESRCRCIVQIITFSENNIQGETILSPSFILKKCPTPMEVAGGGLPERVWALESHCMHIAPINNFNQRKKIWSLTLWTTKWHHNE